ncbi:EGF-like domain-containing protein [Meloidogyne graminicola]|uniref:EGF-like domain-containing protein n=1 Tax=Meloidogyne graminicola TaxID=189291 RepID=A0A8S9ZKN7_9BILA|nr:EGF-like domain-containing protein [Meloidogyne graminicola]
MRYQENIHCNNSQQQSLTWLLPLNNREEQRGQLLQQQQRMRRRRRSVSPITEVTVQLPSSIYRSRPIHNTRSAGCPQQLHQSQSLTLAEFHELLLRIQREMQTRQHLEESEQQNTAVGTIIGQQNYHNDPLFSPTLSALPIEPPPSYNELMNH